MTADKPEGDVALLALHSILHYLRNPYGHTDEVLRVGRREAADLLESQATRIGTLEQRIAELETALLECVDVLDDPDNPAMYGYEHVVQVARRALREGMRL
jgi:hypothetical protein